MRTTKRDIFALILNIFLIIFECRGFFINSRIQGWGCLIFYTQLSNLILLISAIIYSIFLIVRIFANVKCPKWIDRFKFAGTTSVTITFLVVIFILSGYTLEGLKANLFDILSIYHHNICPILGIITFIFFEKHDLSKVKDVFIALIFTFLYGGVAIVLNAIGFIRGPYFFLLVREQPIILSIFWFILIYAMAFGIGAGLRVLNKKCSVYKKLYDNQKVDIAK